MTDEIPSASSIVEFEPTVTQSDLQNEDDNYSPTRNDETINENRVPSMDEITRNNRVEPRTSVIPDFDDSDDDDDNIQVIINNYEPQVSTFHINRPNNRPLIPTNLVPGPRINAGRGGDIEVQGMIRGQQNYEDDIESAHKDEEKPWKKPGADITDYFNFGFTEETWAQYCDRQRRLRAENNLARIAMNHMQPVPPMGHPMFPHPMMMANRPMNMQVVPRPMHARRPDGRIGVIGTIDQNSRRIMLERSSSMNESPFPTDQPSNEEIVDDFISTSASTNGHALTHGMPPNYPHHITAIGVNRVPFIAMQPRISYRPPFAPPYAMAGPQYFPRGPIMPGMHGERPPQPYLIPQQNWNEPAMASHPDFHSEPPNTSRSSRSATPEEKRTTTTNSTDQNEKSSKEDRYKERDDRDRRSHHRHDKHEYDHPSRKRHHRDDRSHSSRRTPTKTNSTRNDSSPVSNNQSESISDSRSSSRRSDPRKPSKRSLRDSSDERNSGHRYERSSHSDTKPSINQ